MSNDWNGWSEIFGINCYGYRLIAWESRKNKLLTMLSFMPVNWESSTNPTCFLLKPICSLWFGNKNACILLTDLVRRGLNWGVERIEINPNPSWLQAQWSSQRPNPERTPIASVIKLWLQTEDKHLWAKTDLCYRLTIVLPYNASWEQSNWIDFNRKHHSKR